MSKCYKCDKKCDFEEYQCKNCGEVFWQTRELFEKHKKKDMGKIKTKKREKYIIDKDVHRIIICKTCKKDTIISEKRDGFPYTWKEKYFCDHCGNFIKDSISQTVIMGLIETILSFGILIYMVNTYGAKATDTMLEQVFGISIFIGGVDGIRRLFSGIEAYSKSKNG